MGRNLVLETEWKIRFEDHKKRGLSIKGWCAKNGFKSTTFHYWIKRFKIFEKKVPQAKAQFAEVILESCSANATVTNIIEENKIYLSYGSYTIGISDRFNPTTLAELLKVLQRL